jgi:hypothetical protein
MKNLIFLILTRVSARNYTVRQFIKTDITLLFLTENIATNVTLMSIWQVCKPGALISNAVKV